MLELVQYIVNQFAEDKEHIEYAVNEKERVIEIVVTLPSSDMGRRRETVSVTSWKSRKRAGTR